MQTRKITKVDFDRIVEVIDHWWGGPISTFAHPIFFYELGGHALIVEQGDEMIGFLLGFVARPEDGKATEEARRALAAAIGVARSDVRLISGARSRVKVFAVTGWSSSELEHALQAQ